MTMTVKNNLSALNTLNQLDRNQSDLTKQLQKLSSGMNLNTAKDSPSAYAISERMRVQIRGLSQDISNAQNARALMNTAEGAVQSTIEILKTFKDKALDAANDTNTDTDRATIQRELDQLIAQIDDNAYVTYNGKILLDGSMGGNMPADEQGVILDFMSSLDNANLSAQDALDQAINYASG
ncbi:MAG: flagellin, partial [Schwartzia sp.]|nr:flagellin [Schwartzia sp. (in: firmicutes)]